MAKRVFFDTNIFVYEFDPRNKEKQRSARKLIHGALDNGEAIISYQVIQEFLNVMTGKFVVPLSTQDLEAYLMTVLWPMCKSFPTPDLYLAALAIREQTQWKFFDSLIVGSALLSNCAVLYSEDLQHGRIIDGLEIRNPFA